MAIIENPNASPCLKVHLFFPWMAGVLLLVASGCSRKSDIQSAASQLKQAFPEAAIAAPPASDNSIQSGSKPVDVNAYVGQALLALQNKDDLRAATILSTVQRQRSLTGAQRRAIHETMGKVQMDLVNRAAQGDVRAKAEMDELLKQLSR
jgi:hypothetical protein